MAKSPLRRYDVFGIIVIFTIIIGIPILIGSFLLWINIRLFFIGISFLAFSGIAIFIARKRVAELKRVHPEMFKVLEEEDNTRTTKCAICGSEPAFRYRCYYCRKYFCEEHKLPKSHRCKDAPPLSLRTVLLLSPVLILIGTLILYISLLPSVMPPRGSYENIGYASIPALALVLIGLGILGPLARLWEEKQNRRAMEHAVTRT